MKNISIIGATGSIGSQALDVIRNEKDSFKLWGISSNTNVKKTIDIIKEFEPKYVAVCDHSSYNQVKEFCDEHYKYINVLYGMEGLKTVASLDEIDIVLTSVVGISGLLPTKCAIEAHKDIALANKETLVAGGNIITDLAKKNNVKILPVDSEHGAIFQCLMGNNKKDIKNILITASGGPFRGKKREDLLNVRVGEALNHPRWKMGKKISIDSATLMNKGLEVIEAHWLFNIDFSNIKVVVHPQSVIHSMVEFVDGSIIAQIASTDMRLPIQFALNYPERKKQVVNSVDFFKLGNVTFEEPDIETFRCLKLAIEAGKEGGNMTVVLNAANEVAVNMFLNDKIKFLEIADIVEDTLNNTEYRKVNSIEDIMEIDRETREKVIQKYDL